MCSSVSRLRGVCRVIQDDFCKARIEVYVDDVYDDVLSRLSRSYHMTDSGGGSRLVWRVIRNKRGSETQWNNLFPISLLTLPLYHKDRFHMNKLIIYVLASQTLFFYFFKASHGVIMITLPVLH